MIMLKTADHRHTTLPTTPVNGAVTVGLWQQKVEKRKYRKQMKIQKADFNH